ncbi:hypothetical protein ACJX0J_007799, partial [Zea mays]
MAIVLGIALGSITWYKPLLAVLTSYEAVRMRENTFHQEQREDNSFVDDVGVAMKEHLELEEWLVVRDILLFM